MKASLAKEEFTGEGHCPRPPEPAELRGLSGHCSWKQPRPGLLFKKGVGTREQKDKSWL